MDQMEHNVKIKTHQQHSSTRPFLHYEQQLNRTHIYPSFTEQAKLLDRFKDIHWQTDHLSGTSHDDKMKLLKTKESGILDNQEKERRDVAQHRLNHLQGIKDNIEETRERFYRRRESERPGATEKKLGEKRFLYKIVNDAKHVRY